MRLTKVKAFSTKVMGPTHYPLGVPLTQNSAAPTPFRSPISPTSGIMPRSERARASAAPPMRPVPRAIFPPEEGLNSLQAYFQAELGLLADLAYDRLGEAVALLERARAQGQRVFLFGNGGSAATASHFACDLGKGTIQDGRPRLRVISLNDNMPTFSAYANDQGYDSVFAEPLVSLAERGDVAIAFSASGNSPNVLRAIDVALGRGLATIGFTGFDGGRLKECVQVHVNVPSRSFGHVEDIHLAMAHAICEMLKLKHES